MIACNGRLASSSASKTKRVRERPRIAMVSANAYPVMGGVETHVYEVAPRIAAAGFDVTILTTDLSTELPQRDEIRGVPVIRVPAAPRERDYYWAPDIYRTIGREKWGLVHCQGYHTLVAPLAMAASTRNRTPYVVTFHSGGHDSATRNRMRSTQHLVLRPLLRRAARLIAVSGWEARHFATELRLGRNRFAVIPNGAELGVPAGSVPASAEAVDRDTPLIVSVGRLERYKGHQRVIAAFPELLTLVPGARLRIVGGGPYDAELRRLAQASGVGERIDIGPVDARDRAGMAALLSSAAVVVAMSEYESQGIAVLEALALRRRVVVADTSALSEFARDGVARGVPLDAPAPQLAQAIYDELHGPLRPAYELPTWDECAAALARLYTEVLAA